MTSKPRRLIVGITGATGAVYGCACSTAPVQGLETHLIVTAAGVLSCHELGLDRRAIESRADRAAIGDVGAAVASGSFAADAMVVAPVR